MPFEPPDGMDFEETKRWVELMTKTELEGLAQAQPFQINLTAYQAWLLLQLLQQGYHRCAGDAKDLARDLGDTVVEGYLARGTVLRHFADAGWANPPQRLTVRDAPGVPDAYRRAFER